MLAWTISILGIGSMFGTMATGYLSTIILPKYVLMGIFGLRAVFLVIIAFIPISVTTVVVFSVFFGVNLYYALLKKIILLTFILYIVSLVINCSTYNQICWRCIWT